MLRTVMERETTCRNRMCNVIREMKSLRKNEKRMLKVKGCTRKSREDSKRNSGSYIGQ